MVQKSMQMVEDCWINRVIINCVVIYRAFCRKFLSLWCVLVRSFF